MLLITARRGDGDHATRRGDYLLIVDQRARDGAIEMLNALQQIDDRIFSGEALWAEQISLASDRELRGKCDASI